MTNMDKLKRLQSIELEIMDEIHRLCIKHNIPYFLDSGSAIGAVRHSGFIPWDDDMDVGMLRSDYNRFLAIAKHELKEGFTIQTHETDPNVYKFYTKIRKDNTYYPSTISGRYQNQGIAVDIFPFDNALDDPVKAQKELEKIRFLYKIVRARANGKRGQTFVHRLLYLFVSLLNYEKLREKYVCLCTRHNHQNTARIICYLYKMSQKQNLFFNISEMYPVKPITFENREYMIMKNPDYYLKIMYGNYMVLPPEEKRRTPDLSNVIFDVTEK